MARNNANCKVRFIDVNGELITSIINIQQLYFEYEGTLNYRIISEYIEQNYVVYQNLFDKGYKLLT